MTWTAERIEMATALWAIGESISDIGVKVEKTRGAVAGKLQRLGLLGQPRPKTGRRKPTERRTMPRRSNGGMIKRTRIIARPLPPEPPAPAQALMLAFIDLKPHHCRWPVGDPKQAGFGFCGCRKLPGSSYCAHHAWVSMSPAARRASR